MSSKFVKDLYEVADMLEQDNRPKAAKKCREGGKRIDIMESILLERLIEDVNKGD